MELALAYIDKIHAIKEKKVDGYFTQIKKDLDEKMEQFVGAPNTAETQARLEMSIFDYIQREASKNMAKRLDENVFKGLSLSLDSLEITPMNGNRDEDRRMRFDSNSLQRARIPFDFSDLNKERVGFFK